MKLHRLTMRNFMPYKDENVIDFPLDATRNIMIVFGNNMRGKTSFLNALRWGFYGKAIGRHSRVIPLHEIVNKDAAQEDDWRVEVFIKFEADGHEYDLRRSATKRSVVATPSRSEDFVVTTHLTRDGIAISGEQVEAEINQFAPEKIARFFLFDGELLQEYETLLIEGSDQGRQIKEAIEQVLGVPSLTYGRAELGTILKQATKKQTSDIALIDGLKKQADRQQELTVRQEAHERDLEAHEKRLADCKSEIARLGDDLDASDSVIAAKAQLDLLEERRTSLIAARDLRADEKRQVLAQAWRDLLDVKLSARRNQLLREQARLTQGLQDKGRVQAEVKNLERLISTDECPTCEQKVDKAKREALGAALGKLQAEFGRLQDETSALQSVSSQLEFLSKMRGVNARERLALIERDSQIAEVGLTKDENDIERLRDEIAGHDTAELARKRAMHAERQKDEGRLLKEIDDTKKALEKIRDEIGITRRAIEGFATARSQRSTHKVKLATELENIFSTSIERLRDKLRERVQSLATEAFSEMTTQKAYRGLEINPGYGLKILDERNRPVSLRSAGAEQIVALSLIDGLNRTGRAVGPVIMDTPFGRLDLEHRDNILSYLPKVTSQFVLLVHSGEIRRDTDLVAIAPRIGATYEIREISSTQSKIERTAQ